MGWDSERARNRINGHLATVPDVDMGASLKEHFARLQDDRALATVAGRKFRNGRAVLVRGAHLYGKLLDFDNLVVDERGEETEESHARILRFLNAHFRVWDSVVDEEGADRVDYHSPRLHAVISEPEEDEANQIARAVALADKLQQAAREIGDAYGFPSRIRFGIDAGPCLAMSTGRDHEQDVLFLGSPANHAAKVAEAEQDPGIFLTDNAKARVSKAALHKTARGTYELSNFFIESASARYQFDAVDRAASSVVEDVKRDPKFVFFRPTPPLSDLKFSDLMPSNTARLGVASLFADVHGFTAYVDNAIKGGERGVKHAVKAIHVIREELNCVLQDDFDGKRVRFIGDCIQGLIAEGERRDEPRASVKQACLCGSGMRESFSLCKDIVGGIDELDLAVGVEYGNVPITRIGKIGEESIRCAAGKAVIESERCQSTIEKGGFVLGPVAEEYASEALREAYQNQRRIISYAAAADMLEAEDSPVAATVHVVREARPHIVSRKG